jgi:hypothetical protein
MIPRWVQACVDAGRLLTSGSWRLDSPADGDTPALLAQSAVH